MSNIGFPGRPGRPGHAPAKHSAIGEIALCRDPDAIDLRRGYLVDAEDFVVISGLFILVVCCEPVWDLCAWIGAP